MQTTAYLNKSNYLVLIMQVEVDSKVVFKADYNRSRLARGAMFDTGTTFTFFEARLYDKLMASINRHCSRRGGCVGIQNFDENTCVNLLTNEG